MTRAYPWDGVGPRESCLMLTVWDEAYLVREQWLQFDWLEGDDEYRCGTAIGLTWDGESFAPDAGFTVTHYAALPTIATVNRIENDVEEGRVLG